MTNRQSKQINQRRKRGSFPSWLNSERFTLGGALGSTADFITFYLPMNNSGPSLLSDSLTINGTTVTASFIYSGGDAYENVFRESEDFTGTDWAKTRMTVSGGVIAAPAGLGGTLADGMVSSADANSHYILESVNWASADLDLHRHTFSVYAKAGDKAWILLHDTFGADDYGRYFNVSTGVTGGIQGEAPDHSGIEDAGDGWYRCWISKKVPVIGARGFYVYPAEADGDLVFSGDASTIDFYLWGTQIEKNEVGSTGPGTYLSSSKVTGESRWFDSTNQHSPLTGSSNDITLKRTGPFLDQQGAVQFNGSHWFESPNTTDGDFGDDDLVFEVIFKAPAGVTETLVGKYVSTNTRWEILIQSNFIKLTLADGTTSVLTNNEYVADVWNHAIFFVDKSGSMVGYINKVAAAAVSVSSVTDLDNSAAFTIGARDGGGIPTQAEIAHVAMWRSPQGWLDTHLQADVATERYHKLTGVYPTTALGTPTPDNITRASTAYVPVVNADGFMRNHLVPANTMRVGSQIDSSGSVVKGFLSEPQRTQLLYQTNDLTGAAWTANASTITVSSTENGPIVGEPVHILTPSVGSAQHNVTHTSITSTPAVISCYVKEHEDADNGWCYLRYLSNSGVYSVFFEFATETATGNGQPDDVGVEKCGNGWYRLWSRDSICNFLQVCTTTGFGTFNYNELSGDSELYIQAPQVENTNNQPSSYIKNTVSGSTLTRAKDHLRFPVNNDNILDPSAGNPITVQATVRLSDNNNQISFYAWALSDGGSSADQMSVFGDSAEYYRGHSVSTEGANGTINVTNIDHSSGRNVTTRLIQSGDILTHYVASSAGSGDDSADVGGPVANALDQLHIGCSYSAIQQVNGLVSEFIIYSTDKGAL